MTCRVTLMTVNLRSDSMKHGLVEELQQRRKAIMDVKAEMEWLYAQDLEQEDNISKWEQQQKALDAAYKSFAGTLRSVKVAIATWIR